MIYKSHTHQLRAVLPVARVAPSLLACGPRPVEKPVRSPAKPPRSVSKVRMSYEDALLKVDGTLAMCRHQQTVSPCRRPSIRSVQLTGKLKYMILQQSRQHEGEGAMTYEFLRVGARMMMK